MNTKIQRLLLLICFIVIQFQAMAQTLTVRGEVKDTKGETLIGVTVGILNDQDRFVGGTVTDFNGQYTLALPDPKFKLQFSFIGYESKTISVQGKEIHNVILEEQTEAIGEVVVTASKMSDNGFTPVALKDLASSVDQLEMKEVAEVPASSLGDALQGRMANMDIVNSGEPGGGMSIRIRGTTSLNASSEPLIVVDGIPYDTQIEDDFDFSSSDAEDYGSLADIAPEDIKSIEILKDAGATAVWGSRGANGVIVITTKRGKKGKTRVNYSSKLNINFEPAQIPMLSGDEFSTYIQEAYWNTYRTGGWANNRGTVQPLIEGINELSFNPNYQYFDEYNQNTNWLDEITRNAYNHSHNLSIAGGGDKARYRLSFGYNDEMGTTIGTDYERFTTLVNIDYDFSKKLRLSTDFSLTQGDKSSNYKGLGDPRGRAMMRMPNLSPYYIADEGNPYFAAGERTDVYFQREQDWQGKAIQGWYNPVAMVNESFSNVISNRIRSVFKLNWKLLNPLTYQFNLSFDKSISKKNDYLPQVVTGVPWNNVNSNMASDATTESFVINAYNKLIYRPRINEDHRLTMVGSVITYDKSNSSYLGKVSGLGSVNITDPAADGKIRAMGSGNTKNRTIGMLANAHYILKDKYIVSGGLRFDGNSKFGGAKRWGAFPNVSLAWRLSNEDFIQQYSFINDLKVRASYGESGNAPGTSYGYYGNYSSYGTYLDMDAIKPASMQLETLKWETVVQKNIGFDFSGFDNGMHLNVDLYSKTTHDMLQRNASLPSSTGYAQIGLINYGTMRNYGWEITSDIALYKKNGWNIRLNMNLSRNRNEVLEMPENINLEKYTFNNGQYARRLEMGNPLGSFYGYVYDGVYKVYDETIVTGRDGEKVYDLAGNPITMKSGNYTYQPGDAKYRDINFDGVINENDLVYLGNAMPIVTGGLGPRISYKGLSFNMFVHFRLGQDIVNAARMSTENMHNKSNQSTAILARWRKPGDETDMPRALYNMGYNWLGSSRFVEDGSYARLKQITLSYTLPKAIAKRLDVNKFKIYMTGYDLLTFTNYTGQDPEIGIGGKDPFAIGYDRAKTPRPKRFALGVNVEF